MEGDWADDETMSAEETLRRFEALNPEPTRGPRKGQHIFVKVAESSTGSGAPEASRSDSPSASVGVPPYSRRMAPEVAEVLETVKAMTHAQRADLAYQVLLTLDEGSSEDPAAVEAAWRDEVGRRVDDYLAGNTNLVSVEESHAKIRADLAANPE